MDLVLATELLDGPGGSETYLVTVAEHLVRLGHRVTTYARRFGPMADRAREVGADVVAQDGLPERCDGVLVQDVGMAYELATRWPQLPQVVLAHSALFDVQLPPLFPVPGSIVVVLNDRVRRRVDAMPIEVEVVRLRQPIDTLRFTPQGSPGVTPRRAVLLGNYLQGSARDGLLALWTRAGVEVEQVGVDTAQTLDAAARIGSYDIVVGKARAILEAMACGRPAFVYDAFGSDGWVTPDNYEAMEAGGFSGQTDPTVMDDAALLRALERYDAGMGRANRELILKHHQARSHAEALVGLFEKLEPTAAATTHSAELGRLSRLRWAAENETWGLRRQVEKLSGRVQELTVELEETAHAAAAHQEEAAAAEQLLAKVRRRARRQRLALQEAQRRLTGETGPP